MITQPTDPWPIRATPRNSAWLVPDRAHAEPRRKKSEQRDVPTSAHRSGLDVTPRSPPSPRVFRRILLSAAVAGIGLALVWIGRSAILDAIGRAWMVSDQLAPAEAAAVLGGGTDTRPAAAAQLYRTGLVKLILVSTGNINNADHDNPDRDALLKLGIPAAAITTFGKDPKNTYAEARAVARWAKQNRARRIIVPTEIFPSRRVKWIFRHELARVGVEVMVEAVAPSGYDLSNWWRFQEGRTGFQTETIKYLYYRLRYWRS